MVSVKVSSEGIETKKGNQMDQMKETHNSFGGFHGSNVESSVKPDSPIHQKTTVDKFHDLLHTKRLICFDINQANQQIRRLQEVILQAKAKLMEINDQLEKVNIEYDEETKIQ